MVAGGLALACLALATPARGEPAFGDSDWVAPAAEARAEDPAAPGPRVAKRDHMGTGELILRLPFRAAFLPLRLIARGAEGAAGYVGDFLKPAPGQGPPKGRWSITPIGSVDPGLGLRVMRRLDSYGDAQVSASGTWAWKDRRNAKLSFRSNRDDATHGLHVEALYRVKPNTVFYGLGNFSQKGNRSVWLGEEGRASAMFHLGSPFEHEVRFLGGVSQLSPRRGFNGGPRGPDVLTIFNPADVPFLRTRSSVISFGIAGDLATLDQVRNPSRGLHARAQIEQFRSVDGANLDYRRMHLEGRAYLPVFATRRVLAFRALHDWVDAASGSAPVPFYRLPETADELRWNGYASHRFSDRHLVLGQVEYRWWLTNKVWAVANANAGEVASTASRLRWADLHEAYGIGLRYAPGNRSVARVDAAKGSEGLVLNLTLEDTF